MKSSSNILIYGNNFSKNSYGLYFTANCDNNYLKENIISYNSNSGFYIFGQNNNIFHNNFISNVKQGTIYLNYPNKWDFNGEGNYWSDYQGLDNGANGKIKGDGIGDTSLPHLGLDKYPFIKPNGWLYPGTPQLLDPGEFNNDGNYTITWLYNPRVLGYILEKDDSEYFESPTQLYNGTNTSYKIHNQPEGTYYYRLNIYNQNYTSEWSTIENITVNYLPGVPRNFQVTVVPDGKKLLLSWDEDLEDTLYYELYYKTNLMSDFELLVNLTYPNNYYLHIGLIDGQKYFYRLRAVDSYGQSLTFTEVISGIPKDTLAPEPPAGLIAEPSSDTKIKLTWTKNQEVDLAGYQVYMKNDTKNKQVNEFELLYTLTSQKTEYTVTGLCEQVNYTFKLKSFDEVPNYSEFSTPAWANTPDLTHPKAPTNLEGTNATSSSLTLGWSPSPDQDVVGYIIYRSGSLSSGFVNISFVLNDTKYIDIEHRDTGRFD